MKKSLSETAQTRNRASIHGPKPDSTKGK